MAQSNILTILAFPHSISKPRGCLFALIMLISATDLLITLIHTYFTFGPILEHSLNRFSDFLSLL